MSRIAVALLWLAACTAEAEPTRPFTHEAEGEPSPLIATAHPGGQPQRTGEDPADADATALDTAAPAEPAPPRCAILSPIDGTRAAGGASLTFDGEAETADGAAAILRWTAPSAGMSVLGDAFDYILPPGPHTITLQAWDDAGRTCVASVEVLVR